MHVYNTYHHNSTWSCKHRFSIDKTVSFQPLMHPTQVAEAPHKVWPAWAVVYMGCNPEFILLLGFNGSLQANCKGALPPSTGLECGQVINSNKAKEKQN